MTAKAQQHLKNNAVIPHGTAELKTERLILRRYLPEDAKILFREFGTDEAMYRYSGWNPYETEAMAEETVRRFIAGYEDPHFYGWAIEYEGTLAGTIGAYDYDPEAGSIETGLSIRRSFWGRGFAGEALTEVLRYLTRYEGIRCVTAWCAADNIGSMKAMEKAGMKQVRAEKGALEIDGKTYDKLYYVFETK